ncbi:permease [Listeria floridensis FSL S10-1187]|uniref:Permease n=1 Tax=Listeria floridensis FSL S10-1187 TaxID=1265817 RepID=A0ABP3AYN4_9LIST|nr:DMT family transporter [Listeria floridensis]EUJ30648.1 permease [Listeria floridensis FSL S10-1187]
MKKGYLYILLATFLFSTMEIAIKISGSTFNPVELNFLRFLIGGIILLPLALKRWRNEERRFTLKTFGFFALTGFFCIVVSMTFFQLAIGYTKASTVAILFSCNPVFVLILAAVFLREKLTRLVVLSLFVSLGGILIIMNPFSLSDPIGLTLALLAAVFFAVYSVISRYGTKKWRYGGIETTCFSFLIGAFELGFLMLLSHIPSIANFLSTSGFAVFSRIPFLSGVTLESMPMLLYLGVGVTGIGFASYFLAMEETSLTLASLVFFIKPALAPILALFILHEPITFETSAGILVILLGSLLTFISGREVPKIISKKEENPHFRS